MKEYAIAETTYGPIRGVEEDGREARSETLKDIVNMFPEEAREQTVTDLGAALNGIIAQRLIPSLGGGSMIRPLRTAIADTIGMRIHSPAELVPGGMKINACHVLVQAIGVTMN